MGSLKDTIAELAKHALAKKGARQNRDFADALADPHVELWAGDMQGSFFYLLGDDSRACLPVIESDFDQHQITFPVIEKSSWSGNDGHIYMVVPLDAGIPLDYLKSLIDDAYQIVWNKLDAAGVLLAELTQDLDQTPYDERALLDRLITIHNLNEHRAEIINASRRAILLRTKESSESDIPLGASKIGGRPDLPAGSDWPIFFDHPELLNSDQPDSWSDDLGLWPPPYLCKPLTFLAQIDLAQIAKMGTPINGLPSGGLLSLFSVWGWEMDAFDLPDDGGQEGFSAAIHTPPGARLNRFNTPERANSYMAAAIEPISILSLFRSYGSNYWGEPEPKIDLNDDEFDRYQRLCSDFRTIQNDHWLGVRRSLHIGNQLGGYPEFSQCYPDEVNEKGLAFLLQIGSDWNAHMCWADDGELTFFTDARALACGRFKDIWCSFQFG